MTIMTTRAPQRRALADKLQALAVQYGAVCSVEHDRDRTTRIVLDHPIGISCGLRISPGQAFVSCWHTRGRMTPDFGIQAGGPVNPFHRGKCTAVQYSVESLLTHWAGALECCQAGEALEIQP